MIFVFSDMSVSRYAGISIRRQCAKADEMMLAIFATMSLALLSGYCGPRWFAVLSILACLAMSIGLFLFEIYSPEYGFRMPWLQVQLELVPTAAMAGGRS
jgi:hypothetical protein